MEFSDNLLIIRKKKNLTQEDLANLIGVKKQSISQWENNLSKPSLETISKLSKSLDVDLSELIGVNPLSEKLKDYGNNTLVTKANEHDENYGHKQHVALLNKVIDSKDALIAQMESNINSLKDRIAELEADLKSKEKVRLP